MARLKDCSLLDTIMGTGVSDNMVRPAEKTNEYTSDYVKTGTSIMAVSCKDGVVLGADSRSSAGVYVANRHSDKLQQLADNIFFCRSGSTAHTQNLGDYTAHFLNQHSMELGETPRVKTAAKLLASLIYNNKDWVSASTIVAGWDPYEGGQVYVVTIGGTLVEKVPFTIGGSGSSYIYGYCDAHFKPDQSLEDARKFVKSALSHAMFRDGSSGGLIRTMVITQKGMDRDTSFPKKVSDEQK